MKTLVCFFLMFFTTYVISIDEDYIVKSTRGKVSAQEASLIVDKVYEKALLYDVDPFIVFGIIHKESLFQKNAKNPDGSYGLMQIQSKVHRKLLNGRSPFDIDANLDVGINVYKNCHDKWKSVERALNCYNGRVFNNQFAAKVLSIFKRMTAHS